MKHKAEDAWYKIDGAKTYGVCAVTVVYAVVVYGLNMQDWTTAIDLILGSSGLAALRHGVAKAE